MFLHAHDFIIISKSVIEINLFKWNKIYLTQIQNLIEFQNLKDEIKISQSER